MNPVSAEIPASGQMYGKTRVLPICVYYEDTDAGGIVYHANYLRLAERGRTEMLRSLGIYQNDMYAQTGLAFSVYKADVHYVKPAKLDDVLLMETALLELTGASMRAPDYLPGSSSRASRQFGSDPCASRVYEQRGSCSALARFASLSLYTIYFGRPRLRP